MGTNNFYYENGLYVLPTKDMDEHMVEVNVNSITNSIFTALKKYTENKKTVRLRDRSENLSQPRSYPSRQFAEIVYYNDFNGYEIEVTIPLIYRSGYYSDINFDWEENVTHNTTSKDDIHILEHDMVANIRGKIKNAFKNFLDEYQKEGQFSNGNAVYSKV